MIHSPSIYTVVVITFVTVLYWLYCTSLNIFYQRAIRAASSFIEVITPGNPRAFDPCSAPHSGAFDANRSPNHWAFDPSKKCRSSVAREKDFVLHVTSHNFSWFSTKFMLIYVISSVLQYSKICHYRKLRIFRRTWGKLLASTLNKKIKNKKIKT